MSTKWSKRLVNCFQSVIVIILAKKITCLRRSNKQIIKGGGPGTSSLAPLSGTLAPASENSWRHPWRCCVVICRTVSSCILLWGVVMCCDVLCCDVLWCDVSWCVVSWCVVSWCVVLWCVVLWCVVLRCAVLCGVLCCNVALCGRLFTDHPFFTDHSARANEESLEANKIRQQEAIVLANYNQFMNPESQTNWKNMSPKQSTTGDGQVISVMGPQQLNILEDNPSAT